MMAIGNFAYFLKLRGMSLLSKNGHPVNISSKRYINMTRNEIHDEKSSCVLISKILNKYAQNAV